MSRDALRFFRLLRSGWAVDVPGYRRPAGHVGVPPNRGDTAVPGWAGPIYPGWRPTGVVRRLRRLVRRG